MSGDYIKISRKIMEWEWYLDINTCRLFIHMLLRANWKEGKFKGTTVPRGSFVSSYQQLSTETNLTTSEIRTAISHLKKTGELTSKTHSKYTVFAIVNYGLYQVLDTQNDKQTTSKSQPIDTLLTTIEEKKEGKKERKKISVFVPPTLDTVKAYCRERGNAVDAEKFIDFYSSKGWMIGKNKMKDWQAAVRTWEKEKKPEGVAKAATRNKFNNFDQRSYDFAALEEELLSN